MANSDDRIMDAALKLFAAKGFEATGIREIAESVNLSSAALYHYIGTKDDLLFKIMSDSLRRWVVGIRGACSAVARPEQKLVAFVRLHVMYEGHYRLKSVVVDSELRSLRGAHRTKVIALRDEYEKVLTELLAAGKSEGTFVIPDVRMARLCLLEMCNGVSRWYSDNGKLTLEEIADQFSILALALVRAQRAGKSVTPRDLRMHPSSYYLKLAIETSESVESPPEKPG